MQDEALKVGPHAAGVLEQAVDDDLIVYHSGTEQYYTLNRSAREVWHLSDGTRTEAEITTELAARYEVAESAVAGDVADIVENFREAKLI